MRTAITLGFPHGEPNKSVQVIGTDVMITEQFASLKAISQQGEHPQFERIEIWENGRGMAKRIYFDQPEAKNIDAAPEQLSSVEVENITDQIIDQPKKRLGRPPKTD